MNRRAGWWALPLVALSCSAQQATPAGRLSGTNDLALVGDALFITSSTGDELRVLDVGLTVSDFIRAPNPLEPLSIPVVETPTQLARDLRYEDVDLNQDGRVGELTGPYVYAISPGVAELSVVSADGHNGALKEVVRLATQEPVTAAAARAALGAEPSQLYFARFDGQDGALLQLALPAPDALAAIPPAEVIAQATPLLSLPGEAVTALLALPGTRVAIATRSMAGTSGRTFILDTATNATVSLSFPVPVTQLATASSFGPLAAGSRVFGVLDEETCGDDSCRGILAVDVDTGAVALDVTGYPMLPIRSGQSLIRGLAVSSGMTAPGGATEQLLGAGTTSAGEIIFFDAATLRVFDFNLDPAAVASITYRSAPNESSPEGQERTQVGGPQGVAVADGAAKDETVVVIFEGLISGLEQLPVPTGGLRFEVPSALVSRVQVGDRIVVEQGETTCAEVSVAALEADAVLAATAVDTGCLSDATFGVRASGSQPYTVVGTVSGFMGRTAANQAFAFPGAYFFHPDGFNPALPQLTFAMGPQDPAIQRNDRYQLIIEDNFAPTVAVPDPNVTRSGFNLPSAVVLDAVRQRAYVAYPSGNAVLLMTPATVTPGLNRNVEVRR